MVKYILGSSNINRQEAISLSVIIHTPIVPTLRRVNEDRDALASRTAGAVLRRSHAERHCH